MDFWIAEEFARAVRRAHAIQVYRRLWDDAKWAPFFNRMKELRATFADAAHLTPRDIEQLPNRPYVSADDAASAFRTSPYVTITGMVHG